MSTWKEEYKKPKLAFQDWHFLWDIGHSLLVMLTPQLCFFTPPRKGTQRLQVSSSAPQKLPQVCSWQGPVCTEDRRSVQNSPEHPVMGEGERSSASTDKSVCLHSHVVFSRTYWIKITFMLVSYVKTIKTHILSADLKNSKPTESHVRELQRQIQLKSNTK